MDTQVSIGQVKRDISELVNRVAFGKERIILTSRGKPKAVIVSIEDYTHLQQLDAEPNLKQWQIWLARHRALNQTIEQPVDVDALWHAAREDLEARDDNLVGS